MRQFVCMSVLRRFSFTYASLSNKILSGVGLVLVEMLNLIKKLFVCIEDRMS